MKGVSAGADFLYTQQNYKPGKDGGGVEICFARLLNCLPLHNALLRAAKIDVPHQVKPDKTG